MVIKLNTKQPITVSNSIKMRIMIELSTEYGQFQVLFILLGDSIWRKVQIQPTIASESTDG